MRAACHTGGGLTKTSRRQYGRGTRQGSGVSRDYSHTVQYCTALYCTVQATVTLSQHLKLYSRRGGLGGAVVEGLLQYKNWN